MRVVLYSIYVSVHVFLSCLCMCTWGHSDEIAPPRRARYKTRRSEFSLTEWVCTLADATAMHAERMYMRSMCGSVYYIRVCMVFVWYVCRGCADACIVYLADIVCLDHVDAGYASSSSFVAIRAIPTGVWRGAL
jgi:hypothetical protein